MTSRPRQLRKRHVALPLLSLGVLALGAWINLPIMARVFRHSALRVALLPPMPPVQSGERVLILSPHPDDESLCCSGLIQQVQAAGGSVYVAWVTPGDGFEFDAALTERVLRPGHSNMRALGNTRAAEAIRAVGQLGIPQNHTFMLGYPDGGLRALLRHHEKTPFTARLTGASAVYVNGAFTPNAPFTRAALESDLRRVLRQVKPDMVLAPAPQDFHRDHQAVSQLAQQILTANQQPNRLWFWVVHGGLEWPIPKGLHPELPLTLPPRASRLNWYRLDLTAEQEQLKLTTLNTYHTQTRVMSRFLHAFVRKNELFTDNVKPAPR